MSDEMEKIAITVSDTRGACTRIMTDEAFVEDTQWPHLVEVFLEQLQGLGYKFYATPEEMVDVLEEFHRELVCAECDGCEEDKPVSKDNTRTGDRIPDISSQDPMKKYPYIGYFTIHPDAAQVCFIKPFTGYVVASADESYKIGYFSERWVESSFTKVSK